VNIETETPQDGTPPPVARPGRARLVVSVIIQIVLIAILLLLIGVMWMPAYVTR
jgi:hypothetical protein